MTTNAPRHCRAISLLLLLLLPFPLPAKAEDPPSERRPQIAIIIDDMGYTPSLNRAFLDLDLPLSFSFLPAAPHTRELAEEAHGRGRDVLVHIPMEPRGTITCQEPDTLRADDTAETLDRKLSAMLAAVPHARGANNHMGSLLTERDEAMQQVLAILGRHAFFFIDSATTPASRALIAARRHQVPAARRLVFLDAIPEAGRICGQLALLADEARKNGEAIAIGHPTPATLNALTRCAQSSLSGADLVAVHRLAR